jgi:hypothetical protein
MAMRKMDTILGAAMVCGAVSAATNTRTLTGRAAFSDFRGEQPGTMRRITAADLPKPYATSSASDEDHVVARPGGEYQDFLTGFVNPNGDVWGRPVGVTVASDGSLMLTDDGSRSMWRVSYAGK